MSRKVDEKKQVKLAKFAHFVLRAKDLNKSVAWYKTVLGLDVQHKNPMLVFMTYDDEHHRLAIVQAQNKDEAPKGTAGVDHVAYTLDSLEDLLVLYKRLKGEGILPVWPINHGLTTSLYYEDPDGIRVEFQVENFETKVVVDRKLNTISITGNSKPFKSLNADWSFIENDNFCKVIFLSLIHISEPTRPY